MEKLFLLDAYALIYRAYYALINAPRVTSKGFNASAIFGFCNTLDEILKKENPTHIAVCFDPHGPTFRHEMYDGYKAQREAQPEDITASVPIIKEIIKAYRIPVFEVPGYEADDVIGTIANIAESKGYKTYMMTPDKDYGQLVTENILMYRPSLRGQGFEVRGVKEVCEKHNISRPSQVIDLLALEGDAIDNIPGCPGVGPKTASKLIGEYDSVENLLSHADEIKGAIGQKIRDNAEKISFSKKLATIKTDVPVEVDFEQLKRQPKDIDALREIYTELEFKTFLTRLGVSPSPGAAETTKKEASSEQKRPATISPAQPSLFDFMDDSESNSSNEETADASSRFANKEIIPEDYKAITSDDEIRNLINEAINTDKVGIALYSVGVEAMTAELIAIAISTVPGKGRYIEIPTIEPSRNELLSLFKPLLSSASTILVSHDIKRDMVLLHREKLDITARYFDTQLAHYLYQPEMRHRLADIAMNILEIEMDNFGETPKPFTPIPAGEEVKRVCQQADMTLRLEGPLSQLLEENGQRKLLDDIELPLAAVLADMEWTGVRIDTAELAKLSTTLTSQLHELEEKAYELAGEKFNISSPMQVGEILFGKLQLDAKAKRTKSGSYSTTEEILLKYRDSHPLVGLILEVRGLKKLLTTYVDALPALVNPLTSKLHSTFNQAVTATGRISSANPNLQNIPIRTDDGKEVRRAFIADEGCIILSADYSQIELRLLANLSDDPELTEAFNSGLDIHRATAAKIYHVAYDEVTESQRRKAKTANFGTVYGISAFGLSERLNIPRSEAKELIEGYFSTYPHIRQFIEESIEHARKKGYVSTIMGRKRYLPDINSRNATVRSYAERNAVNAPIQGSAADIIKLAMIRVYNEINRLGLKSKMILQVHDELVFNVIPDELSVLQELVIREMSNAFSGKVTLDVSAGTGHDWLTAH